MEWFLLPYPILYKCENHIYFLSTSLSSIFDFCECEHEFEWMVRSEKYDIQTFNQGLMLKNMIDLYTYLPFQLVTQLVTILANTKWCEKPTKMTETLVHGYMGTHLRALRVRESYPMNTNMTGFRWFSKIFGRYAPTSLSLYSHFHKIYFSKLYCDKSSLMAKAGKTTVSLSLGLRRSSCHL